MEIMHPCISPAGELKRNPNDCVVCGAILHELDAQQCGVWGHTL